MMDEILPTLTENQSFNCTEGCGECTPVEFDYVYSETRDGISDEIIEQKTHKAYKSSCCGGGIEIWDSFTEEGHPMPAPVKRNPLQDDLEPLHPSLKERRFMATNMFDIITGITSHYTILCKERGRNKKWQRLGNQDGPLAYQTEKEAKADARRLREWAN